MVIWWSVCDSRCEWDNGFNLINRDFFFNLHIHIRTCDGRDTRDIRKTQTTKLKQLLWSFDGPLRLVIGRRKRISHGSWCLHFWDAVWSGKFKIFYSFLTSGRWLYFSFVLMKMKMSPNVGQTMNMMSVFGVSKVRLLSALLLVLWLSVIVSHCTVTVCRGNKAYM